MIWQGEGLITTISKYSEAHIIITLFTADKGMFKTLVRGGQSKKKIGIFQPGNVISGVWKARFEEQLGSFTAEGIVKNFNAKFLFSKTKILILKTILELISIAVKNGEIYQELYSMTLDYFTKLQHNAPYLADYINYELQFLAQIGYGLDLSKCAVTGKTTDLYYVSPKTGCAVTKETGEKYHNKLIIIPRFLQGEKILPQDINAAFNLTGFFIEKYFLTPNHLKMPHSRTSLKLDTLGWEHY